VNPGAGFGTGTHETTQLCLERIGELSLQQSLGGISALDFGSGSGILSIGLALLGARVDSVEIDSLAVENARENFELNQVSDQIRCYSDLSAVDQVGAGKYKLIVANILRPVLMEFAKSLVDRLQPGGILVLSGLIEEDVAPVQKRYLELLAGYQAVVSSKNEWRAVVFEAGLQNDAFVNS
jgi:ribosomal protein L11 methyltransferase